MANDIVFSDVPIGRSFISPSGILYKKETKISAKPIRNANGVTITNGDLTVKFFGTSIILQFYTG